MYVFSDNVALRCDVLNHFAEHLSLDLPPPLQIGAIVVKIEEDRALMKLLDEELWMLRRRCPCDKIGLALSNCP